MKRIYHIDDTENYNTRESEDTLLERAFKEGCEHGYKKALKELDSYDEKKAHSSDGFEDRIARLKRKYE